jgi:hypothetical protein
VPNSIVMTGNPVRHDSCVVCAVLKNREMPGPKAR